MGWGHLKLPKKKLLEMARREARHIDRPLVMTQDVENRYLAMKKAKARERCPLCGTPFDFFKGIASGCKSKYRGWWVRKVCPNCGVIEETEGGTRRTGAKSLTDFSALLPTLSG